MSYTAQVTRFRTASERLLAAIPAQAQARADFEAARDAYDDRRSALLLSGTPAQSPGSRVPSDVREAELARALRPQTCAVRSARDGLRAADAEWEAAKVQERAERESLRCWQREPVH